MNRKTLLAGGVFAALVLIAFAVLRSPEKGNRTGDAPRPIPKIAAGDFDTLEVTKGGATTIVKKDGATYKITAPVQYAAEQDSAKQAFEALEKLDFGGITSDQKAKHDEFEVGDKGVRIVAKKGDKVLADLRVGKVANGLTMLRVEGKDEVWQAVGSLKYQFDKDTSAWRDKSITTFDEADAQKLEIVSKTGGRIVLSKPPRTDGGADEGWKVTESAVKVDPLDKTVASGIVSALYSWKANDFADAPKPDETGLAAPETTITVTLKGDKKKVVQIGKKKGEEDYFVKTGDGAQVFLVKKYNIERINKRPIEFRDKTVCNLNEAEITEVAVTRETEPFTLVRPPGKTGSDGWKLTRPAGATPDPAKVSTLLAAFKEWKAISFAEDNSPKTTGIAKPSATITAKSSVKGSGCVLKVGSPTSDQQNFYAEKVGSPDVVVLPKWSLDRVLMKLDDLKKK